MKKIISIILSLVMLASMLVISADAADPYGTVVEAQYADKKPDMSTALPDASWGELVAHVTKDSANAAVVSYHKNSGTVSPDLYCDVYLRWDSENLYLCFVSFDDDIRGSASHHTGDGILMDMVFGVTDMSHFNADLASDSVSWRDEFCYSVTFANDNKTVDYDGASLKLKKEPVIAYHSAEKLMVAKLEVPFVTLGMSKKDTPKDGDCISFSMCRLEGIENDGYLGWLEWGNYYDSTKETADSAANTAQIGTIEIAETKTGNTIKLVKSEPQTDAGEEDAPTVPAQFPENVKVSSWAKDEVVAAWENGLVPDSFGTDYTKGISRENLSKILSKLLDKVYGKNPTKNSAKFTDTTDADVLKAANLDIITGYKQNDGTYQFKPANTLKRSEMAVIVSRVAKLCGKTVTGYDSEVTFKDTAKHWCKSELGWPVHMGIVKGTSATQFSPENTLTTEQTIMMIYRAYEALK